MVDPYAEEPPSQDHILSNKLYDRLKYISQIIVPLLGSLYFVISDLWYKPSSQILGAIILVSAYLGMVLHFGTKSYRNSDSKYDGSIDVIYITPEKKTFMLNLNKEPGDIEKADQITFKVNPPIL